jgi:gliding motility-associated-like protein
LRLRVLPRPRIVADTHQLAFCRDQAGVQLPVRIEGGTPPYFARWEPPFALDDPLAVAPFASPPRDTAWTLTLQDDLGCSAQPLILRVRVYSLPVADAGPDLSYCFGKPDTLRLRGRVLRPDSTPVPPADWGRYAVRWVPEDGLSDPTSLTPIARPARTTIYTLTLRDRLTSCTNRITILDTLATAVVRVLAVPIADAGPDTIRVCSGDSVRLGGVAAGGDDLTYRWRPVSSLDDPSTANPIARPFQSTRYVVQVANGPCLGIADSIEIIVRERPVVRLDGPLDVCDGDTLPIMIQSRGGTPPYAFEWSAPDRVVERAGGGVGWVARYPEAVDLVVRIRDRFCQGDEASELRATVLAKPVVNILEDQLEICRGDTLRIDTQVESPIPSYRISWTPPDSLIRPDVRSPLAFPDQTTVYRVEARIGRCVSHDSVLLAVLPVPRLRIEGGPDRLCEGESIRFRAIADPSDGFRWVWRKGDGTLRQLLGPEVEDRPEASLRYRAEAMLGPCTTAAEMPVVVFPQAEAGFEASAAGGCGVWEVAFRNTSRKADTFAWEFGDGWGRSSLREPTYRYPLPGRWQVQLIAGVGTPCPDTLALPIAFQHTSMPKAVNFIFSYKENEILFLSQSQIRVAWKSSKVARAIWDLGDGTQASDSAVSHRYRQAGDYLIRLLWEDSAGCTRVDSLPLLRVREPEVDIPTVFTPNGDGIHDQWEITYRGVENYHLKVFDRLGQLLFESSSSNDPWPGTDRVGRAVAEGTYLYVLRIGGKLHRGQVSVLR